MSADHLTRLGDIEEALRNAWRRKKKEDILQGMGETCGVAEQAQQAGVPNLPEVLEAAEKMLNWAVEAACQTDERHTAGSELFRVLPSFGHNGDWSRLAVEEKVYCKPRVAYRSRPPFPNSRNIPWQLKGTVWPKARGRRAQGRHNTVRLPAPWTLYTPN